MSQLSQQEDESFSSHAVWSRTARAETLMHNFSQFVPIHSCAFGLVSNSPIFASSLSLILFSAPFRLCIPCVSQSPHFPWSSNPLAFHSIQWSGCEYLKSYLIPPPSASLSLSFSRHLASHTFVICKEIQFRLSLLCLRWKKGGSANCQDYQFILSIKGAVCNFWPQIRICFFGQVCFLLWTMTDS